MKMFDTDERDKGKLSVDFSDNWISNFKRIQSHSLTVPAFYYLKASLDFSMKSKRSEASSEHKEFYKDNIIFSKT